jgi:hypothetical protein
VANAAALINEGLWRKDKEFQRLPRLAQCTFCQVLSQKDLDTAGGLTLHLELMAKACDELTVEQLKADFEILEQHRFLFVDYDTDELLVRSYVRRVSSVGGIDKNRAWLSVPKNAKLIASPKLRHELALELRRLRLRPADDLADEIDPQLTPSEPPPNSLLTPSGNETPSEGGLNPPSTVQVSVLESLSVVGSVGEAPSEFCNQHLNGTERNCFACGQARRSYPERKARWDEAVKAAQAAVIQAAVDDCDICDEYGDIDLGESVLHCDHNPEGKPARRQAEPDERWA